MLPGARSLFRKKSGRLETSSLRSAMSGTYRQEDVQQILQLAIAHEAGDEHFSREQLQEIAAELGIAPDTLRMAEQEWLTQADELRVRQEFDHYRQRKLRRHGVKFLIVNAFLVCLDILTGGSLSWSLYVVLGWGLVLALRAWQTYQPEGEEYEEALRAWRRNRQLKQSFDSLVDRVSRLLKAG